MTSIASFEDGLRNKSNERYSDTIFNFLNMIEESKRNGVLSDDLLSKTIILEGKLISNQVRRKIKTEEEAETFLTQIPNGKWPCFSYHHKDLDRAYNVIKQELIAASLYIEQQKEKFKPSSVLENDSFTREYKRLF